MKAKIALVHAVKAAIDPIEEAFRKGWPEAACSNILDDSLSRDRERDGTLTVAMKERIGTLARYAAGTGADGILFTCSAFGEAIAAVARELPLPVLKPNEAMFEMALERGRHIGMLATFAPSVGSMEEEFRDLAAERGVPAVIECCCVPDAMAALKEGDSAAHDRLVAEAAPRLAHCDAVLLAQFSTARAAPAVAAALGREVLTSPKSAVSKLRSLVAGV